MVVVRAPVAVITSVAILLELQLISALVVGLIAKLPAAAVATVNTSPEASVGTIVPALITRLSAVEPEAMVRSMSGEDRSTVCAADHVRSPAAAPAKLAPP